MRICLRTRPELDPAPEHGLPNARWSYAELSRGFTKVSVAFIDHAQDFLLPLSQSRINSKWFHSLA